MPRRSARSVLLPDPARRPDDGELAPRGDGRGDAFDRVLAARRIREAQLFEAQGGADGIPPVYVASPGVPQRSHGCPRRVRHRRIDVGPRERQDVADRLGELRSKLIDVRERLRAGREVLGEAHEQIQEGEEREAGCVKDTLAREDDGEEQDDRGKRRERAGHRREGLSPDRVALVSSMLRVNRRCSSTSVREGAHEKHVPGDALDPVGQLPALLFRHLRGRRARLAIDRDDDEADQEEARERHDGFLPRHGDEHGGEHDPLRDERDERHSEEAAPCGLGKCLPHARVDEARGDESAGFWLEEQLVDGQSTQPGIDRFLGDVSAPRDEELSDRTRERDAEEPRGEARGRERTDPKRGGQSHRLGDDADALQEQLQKRRDRELDESKTDRPDDPRQVREERAAPDHFQAGIDPALSTGVPRGALAGGGAVRHA